ncbi:MAG: amidohydrolase family protein [Gammaproteobacteria bacterium]|nr:amidohydrolase family protein [Gammaproteobacteria bacterium]MCY4358767.1 amidohydrolase family protein [Gammaproteobacteria bacterium]
MKVTIPALIPLRVLPTCLALLFLLLYPIASAIVPTPAADQSVPIALIGAIIHVGDGTVIGDGVITFDEGIITAVGTAAEDPDLAGHEIFDLRGSHVYPGFVLPNSSLGLSEVGSVRATQDVVEEGDINASVRSAIAYNTDSEIIPTNRFNGILTAQVTPQGGLISGSSSVFKLDGWNWEDALLAEDVGLHLHWPPLMNHQRNLLSGQLERVSNQDYQGQTQVLDRLFQNASAYTGDPLNLNLQAMQPLFNGLAKLFIHADEAKEIINAVRFARRYGVKDIILVGAADALLVKDFLLSEQIPVIYERIHALPLREWSDVDAPFKTPFLLHEAGIKVGIGGGATSIDRQRNLPFFAGTAAAYGLDRETALGMVTRINAEILGVADRVGTLEAGKDATLFISEGDALEMRTSQVLGAFIQGREIDLNGTQQQLYDRYRDKYQNRVE